MSENTDMARGLLEGLLHEIAQGRQGKQAIVAVDAPNQSFRWIGTVGKTVAGGPVVENTPFFIASIDKLYNATIAMMLAESGKLDVDQSICSYLPETITRGLHHYGGCHAIQDYAKILRLLSQAGWQACDPKGVTAWPDA